MRLDRKCLIFEGVFPILPRAAPPRSTTNSGDVSIATATGLSRSASQRLGRGRRQSQGGSTTCHHRHRWAVLAHPPLSPQHCSNNINKKDQTVPLLTSISYVLFLLLDVDGSSSAAMIESVRARKQSTYLMIEARSKHFTCAPKFQCR
eukprot:scaffold17369_cov97-Skeletonema_dohrnii-CCMP3373.AAC.3